MGGLGKIVNAAALFSWQPFRFHRKMIENRCTTLAWPRARTSRPGSDHFSRRPGMPSMRDR
jgi:hypothetical protein